MVCVDEASVQIVEKEEKIVELQEKLENPSKNTIQLQQDLRRARKDAEVRGFRPSGTESALSAMHFRQAFGRQVASEAARADAVMVQNRELEERNRQAGIKIAEMQSEVEALRLQLSQAAAERKEAVAAAAAAGEQRRRETEEQLERASMLLQV